MPVAGILFVLAFALAAPTAADAEPMILGQTAPISPFPYCNTAPLEILESATEGGNAFAAPRAGTITSWSTTASFAPGQELAMKIYRPFPAIAETYTVIAHDNPKLLKPGVVNTFDTDIPVQAGDILGLYAPNGSATTPNACFYNNEVASDYMALNQASTSDGVSVWLPTLARGARPNISAILQPPPTIGSLAPASGSVKGSTPVAITGTDLENTTAVSFGDAPATGFRVVSEGEILATTPAGTAPGPVTVTVTTVAGTATGGSFAYESERATIPPVARTAPGACVVPKLRGKTLAVARRKIRRSHCRLAKVEGSHQKATVVKQQHPAAGKVRAGGATVGIVLGMRPR